MCFNYSLATMPCGPIRDSLCDSQRNVGTRLAIHFVKLCQFEWKSVQLKVMSTKVKYA